MIKITTRQRIGIEKPLWFRQAAKQGEANAQYHLGFCYQFGTGVDKNNQKAMYWYGKAAEQGNEDAKEQLKTIDNIKNSQTYTFFERYIKKAESGDVEAQCFLANHYHSKGDHSQALSWYHKAAEQNNTDAQLILGDCYYDGLGTEEDYQQAFYWYEKAAGLGNAEAQNTLGDCYYYEDKQKAVYWYNMAAEQDHEEAQCWLGSYYYKGIGAEEDYQQAFYWYEKAAGLGNAEAQNTLGDCYYYVPNKEMLRHNIN